MEDVDAAFQGANSRHGVQAPSGGLREAVHTGLLTFSGLLNALDGVAGQEGKLVIMTTNHPEALDEALVRPGRVDFRAQFHHASREAIQEVFCNFYKSCKSGLGGSALKDASMVFADRCAEGALSMAAIQGHLMQFRDDPLTAADTIPPTPDSEGAKPRAKQFVVPRGAAMACFQEEE